jgi:hypothetical protein
LVTDGDLKGGAPTIINGYLYKPSGSGPFAAVVSIHGCDGAANEKGEVRPLYGTWGEVLAQKGYVVLLIDSFQPRGHVNLCAGFLAPHSAKPGNANGRVWSNELLEVTLRRATRQHCILGQSHGGMALMCHRQWRFTERCAPGEGFQGCDRHLPELSSGRGQRPSLAAPPADAAVDRRVRHCYASGAMQGHDRAGKRRRRSSD